MVSPRSCGAWTRADRTSDSSLTVRGRCRAGRPPGPARHRRRSPPRRSSRRHTYLRARCDQTLRDASRAAGAAGARAAAAVTAAPLADAVAVALRVGAPPAGRLTTREIDVAELVTNGLTNRQIGRRLAISERTAERHVENLRTKLAVGSRAEVAAWFAANTPEHGHHR